ncbi:MAG: hypothetical protein A2Z12_05770 [Actinobacteria bacterium RBG_16_68_21]|nr:MAG: hypothetical protein A2Z12_05770 [Actinobacteria bacterium RBG_16_68_21]
MLQVLTESLDPPSLDTAASAALLQQVGAGLAPPTLRLFVPRRSVAFGRQDAVRPGYRQAVAEVRDAGFSPVVRLAGGKAAVFHEGTLAFAWTMPDDRPRLAITTRFEAIAAIVADAFDRLGIDARIGEVPGEYCPGAYSVNARGARKLMGVGQRLVRGAAHLGGVVVVTRADLVNLPLIPAYRALGYEWDPGVTGAVDEESPVALADVRTALLEAFARAGHDLVDGRMDDETLSRAAALAGHHEIP